MYRADGPDALKCVGETEFVNGVAAMTASGLYGNVRACAGIVGHTDFRQEPDVVEDVLRSHIAGGTWPLSRHPSEFVVGRRSGRNSVRFTAACRRGSIVTQNSARASGFCTSSDCRSTLGCWSRNCRTSSTSRAHSPTRPSCSTMSAHRSASRRMKASATSVSACGARTSANSRNARNVNVKLGGLPMPFAGWRKRMAEPLPTSETLAAQWKPYIDTCIEAFGPARCMFESNFPVDKFGADYVSLWNAFKRIAANYSASEKTALFSGTAARVYRVNLT